MCRWRSSPYQPCTPRPRGWRFQRPTRSPLASLTSPLPTPWLPCETSPALYPSRLHISDGVHTAQLLSTTSCILVIIPLLYLPIILPPLGSSLSPHPCNKNFILNCQVPKFFYSELVSQTLFLTWTGHLPEIKILNCPFRKTLYPLVEFLISQVTSY